jgi:hypothetical protein
MGALGDEPPLEGPRAQPDFSRPGQPSIELLRAVSVVGREHESGEISDERPAQVPRQGPDLEAESRRGAGEHGHAPNRSHVSQPTGSHELGKYVEVSSNKVNELPGIGRTALAKGRDHHVVEMKVENPIAPLDESAIPEPGGLPAVWRDAELQDGARPHGPHSPEPHGERLP